MGADPTIRLRRENTDLFNLINALNPTKVKTGTQPRAAHEVPLLTATVSRVIVIGRTGHGIRDLRTLLP
ncbi:hypothetical protein Tco_0344183 [Tanacetum coccineum]